MKHYIIGGLAAAVFAIGCDGDASKKVVTSESYYFEGVRAFEEKEFDEAVSQFTRALENGGLQVDSLCDARMKRAKARIELEEFDEAKEDLEFLLEGAPDTSAVLATLGDLSVKQKELEDAKRYYQLARKENPRIVVPPELR